ncbi:MAG: hypothetical protein Q8930_15710, partial [Bacillota bacterium]|nr:hypothetical protein [Bacillota bacterium]
FNKLDQIITQSVLSYSSIKVITKFLKELEEPNNTLMRAVVDSKNMMSVRFLMKNIDQPLARNSIRTMIQDSNDVNWKHLNSDYGSLLEKVKDLLGILYDKATNEESYATFANKEKSAADICDLVDRIIQRNYLVFRIPATISNELNFENVTRLMEYSECGHVRKAGYKILGLYHTDQALRAAEAGMKDPNWIVSDAAGDTSRQIRKNIEYEFNLYNSRNDRSLQEGVDDANEDIRLFVLHKMLHLLRQGICFEDKSLKMSLEALTAIDKSISIQAITKKILYLNNNVK